MLQYAALRAPRYTSYPAATEFGPDVTSATSDNWLAACPVDAPLSLYIHVPFCEQVCWYCACNMKLGQNPDVLRKYADGLIANLDLVASRLPARMQIGQLHWGGGTPTAMGVDLMAKVMEAVRSRFDMTANAEIAVELDPRTFRANMAPALGAMGVTRASLGVQTFDDHVQKVVNRVQPFEVVRDAVHNLREASVHSINFDMMYGLPFQTAEIVERDVEAALDLIPDRVALFGYAHVPWAAKRQRIIPEDALPEADVRLDAATRATRQMADRGYQAIGLDHFALPEDTLAQAARNGTLKRNFQGYSVDPSDTLIGIGASAISEFREGYSQNAPDTGRWSKAIEAKLLPTIRGTTLGNEDRLRRDVINELMCNLCVDVDRILAAYKMPQDHLDTEISTLRELAADGLLSIDERSIVVADKARSLLRLVAAAFDAYRPEGMEAMRHAVLV